MIPMMPEDETTRVVSELGLPERVAHLNATRILLQSRAAGAALVNFLLTLMIQNTISARTRELIILRIAWRSRSQYEFSHHVKIARELQIPEDDILGVRDPGSCRSYDEVDRAVLAMTDELIEGTTVSPTTWAILERSFGPAELNELLFSAGFWRMMACWLAVAEPPLEPGVPGWPELVKCDPPTRP